MKKKLFIIVSMGLLSVFVLAYIYIIISSKDIYSDYEKINRKSVLSQKESSYLVYYYMEDCYDCRLVEKKFIEKSSVINYEVYLVDLNDWENIGSSYDWDKHHEEFDIEIGFINDENEKKFYEDESEKRYLNGDIKNEFGEVIDYEIVVCDKEYQFVNSKAKLNRIYAKNNTPNINKNLTRADEIKIPGAPMLLKIEDKKISEVYFDNFVLEYFESIE